MRDEKAMRAKLDARHGREEKKDEKVEEKGAHREKGEGRKDAGKKPEKRTKDAEEKEGGIKHSGSFEGKSNALGHGGRAKQLEARGVPGGVIGNIARAEGAAKGGPNYHGK